MKGPTRVVLDTSVLVSALVIGGGWGAQLRAAWQARRFVPLASGVTAQELMRVLGYPKFGLSVAEQEELLADYLPWVEVVEVAGTPRGAPVCRDPFDQPFVDLAIVGRANALVSGDTRLLALRGKVGRCRVVGVTEFLAGLEAA